MRAPDTMGDNEELDGSKNLPHLDSADSRPDSHRTFCPSLLYPWVDVRCDNCLRNPLVFVQSFRLNQYRHLTSHSPPTAHYKFRAAAPSIVGSSPASINRLKFRRSSRTI